MDFKNKVWIIPQERLKADKEHRVYLGKTTRLIHLLALQYWSECFIQ